jgi:hypothetical protein
MHSVVRAYIRRQRDNPEWEERQEWKQLEKDIDRWDVGIIVSAIKAWLSSYEEGTLARQTAYREFLQAIEM